MPRLPTHLLVAWTAIAWTASAAGSVVEGARLAACAALAGALLAVAGAAASPERRRRSWLAAGIALAFFGLGADRPAERAGAGPAVSGSSVVVAGTVRAVRPMASGSELTVDPGGAAPPVAVRVAPTGEPWLDQAPAVLPGDRVRIGVRPRPSGRPRAAALCPAAVERLEAAGGTGRWRTLPARARLAFQRLARRRLIGAEATPEEALLMALVTGRKSWLRERERRALRWSGLAHLAVVSGLHVGLVVVALAAVCGGPLGRRHRAGQLVALGASAGALALLPATPPVRRAALALLVGRCGLLWGRGGRSGPALAVAALILLAAWPELATSWSFALTVSATSALLLAGRRGGVARPLVAALAPFLATWPLLVAMTGRTSPWGAVANAFAAPAVPVALGAAWLRVLLPEWAGPAGELAGELAVLAARWVLAVAAHAASWTGSGAWARPVGAAWCVLSLASLAVALTGRPRLVTAAAWLCTAACWAWPLSWPSTAVASERAELCVLDVGQGQALLLHGREQAWIIDVGSRWRGRRLRDSLAAAGALRLDGVVLTHLDEDHAGGLIPALAGSGADWVAAPASVRDSAQARALAAEAAERGVAWRWMEAGGRLRSRDIEITALWPDPGIRRHGNPGGLVLQVRAGRLSAVVLGDATGEVESRIAGRGWLPAAPVLVASHHGARGGTTARVLRRVAPDWVVISCGIDNRFGHPHRSVVDRIDQAGAARWITADHGPACFSAVNGPRQTPGQRVIPLGVRSRPPPGAGGTRSPESAEPRSASTSSRCPAGRRRPAPEDDGGRTG